LGILERLFQPAFKPRCPITEEDRVWIEDSLRWLVHQFGHDTLVRRTIITPTPNFFPHEYTGSCDEAEELVAKVAKWLRVDSRNIDVQFFMEDEPPQFMVPDTGPQNTERPAGLYIPSDTNKSFILALEVRTLDDPVVLTATIAHELAHAHLIGGGRLAADAEDQEPMTDLVAVFFGMGIFIANAAFQFSQWTYGQMQGWSASKHGYLPEPMLAYALASIAWTRGEEKPEWSKYLEYNIRVFFDKSLTYLRYHNGSGLKDLRIADPSMA
jgi:hypothetical protein